VTYLDLSVGVVGAGGHQVQDKQLHGLTEVPALQRGEVQEHMDRYLGGGE